MATYLADKVIVFDGIPAKEATCSTPEGLVTGMNRFLKMMDITFRRDPTNFRPRINKLNSQKDQEQKAAGNFFLMESDYDEEKKEKEEKPVKEGAKAEGKKEKVEGKKEKAEGKKEKAAKTKE
jgi:ATP-binding cassette subfamily E protein 1